MPLRESRQPVSVPSTLASSWEVPKGILASPEEKKDAGSYFLVLRNGSPLFCFKKKKNPGEVQR